MITSKLMHSPVDFREVTLTDLILKSEYIMWDFLCYGDAGGGALRGDDCWLFQVHGHFIEIIYISIAMNYLLLIYFDLLAIIPEVVRSILLSAQMHFG